MTAQLPSKNISADQAIAALFTQSQPRVSDAKMRQAVRTLLIGLGEDPNREGLLDTPKRVVKTLKFLTSGYNQSLDELLNGAVFHENTNEMVLVRDKERGYEVNGLRHTARTTNRRPQTANQWQTGQFLAALKAT
jgi:GTP cyclohydrolase IA